MSGGLPRVFWVRQHSSSPLVADRRSATIGALTDLALGPAVSAGQTVAIAVGSRGIAGLSDIVAGAVEHLHALGLHPFVVPAMGSHGGATAEGQAEVLAGYGVTEAGVGAPIRSQMGVVDLGPSSLGFDVCFDRLAFEADHVVIINRVKPHTMFTGDVESGLAKMLLIGLGKGEGAGRYHGAEWDHGWSTIVDTVVPRILGAVDLLAGIAVVENADDDTAIIEAVRASDLLAAEARLLDSARAFMPKLPFADVDLLLIDEIGKNLSGSGFDVNVVGRKDSVHEPRAHVSPRVRTIAVRGLSPGTHGNAHGVGLAELCRTRVLDQMDQTTTWVNALTSGDLPAGMTPIHFATDAALIDAAHTRMGLRAGAGARVTWIRNTLDVAVAAVAEAHLDEARERDDLEVLSVLVDLPLDSAGNLPDHLPALPPPTE